MAPFQDLNSTIKMLVKFWGVLVLSAAVWTNASVKKSMKGIVYIALYVDVTLMVGNIDSIDDAIKAI